MLFRKKQWPIFDQIDDYADWLSQRYSLRAGVHQALLYQIASALNIRDASELTIEAVSGFIYGESSQYRQQSLLVALRSFIRYARLAGYTDLHATDLMEKKLRRPRNERRITEVKVMREKGMSYRQIRRALIERYHRNHYLASIYRWANY